MKLKFNTIPVQHDSFERIAEAIHNTLPQYTNEALDAPVTTEEMYRALKKGEKIRLPARMESAKIFFKEAWELVHTDMLAIIQEMHTEDVHKNWA
jgi:hypothetical protein